MDRKLNWVSSLVLMSFVWALPVFAGQECRPLESFPEGAWREVQKEIETERFEEVQSCGLQPGTSGAEKQTISGQAFFKHISDAIQINTERMETYAGLTNGKSLPLSRALIRFEQRCLVPAAAIDRWAGKFWQKGIGIISNDFVSMKAIKNPEFPPVYRGCLSEPGREFVEKILREFRNDFVAAVFRKDFLSASRAAWQTLVCIEQVEKKERCHLAMVRHFLESLGYGALHAIHYARQSNGKTLRLSKTFLLLQVFPFSSCLGYDLEAQKIHQLGIGILVNDLPSIPFKKEWDALASLRKDL